MFGELETPGSWVYTPSSPPNVHTMKKNTPLEVLKNCFVRLFIDYYDVVLGETLHFFSTGIEHTIQCNNTESASIIFCHDLL